MPTSAPPFPPALVRAVAREAQLQAALVDVFLARAEAAGLPGQPPRLTLGAALHLGAALRLITWEAAGVAAHRDAGLPPADVAIRTAARVAAGAEPPDAGLLKRVLGAYVDRFAWDAPRLLGADALIGPLGGDEDAAAKAVAAFLWAARRPRPPEPGEPK